MMTKIPALNSLLPKLLLFTGSLLLGCVYEPTEEFFKEVKSLSPEVLIDLSEYNDRDTILLEKPTTFKFSVDITEPSAVQFVEIVLDSTALFTSGSTEGVFTLSQSQIAVGTYVLTIRFLAKSNSGSLADNLGAENFQVWRSWVLKVIKFDNNPPPAPELTITEKEGRLRLDWTPYTKKSFVSYKLTVGINTREIIFNDSLSTFWVDSSFLWGSASYTLTTTNAYGSASAAAYLNEPQKLTVISNPDDSTALVKWKPSRFYNAFDKVVISENQTVRETISKASDSTLTLKLNEVLWGRSESVMLQGFPKDKSQNIFEEREHLNLVRTSMLRGSPKLSYQNGIGKVIGHSTQFPLLYFYDEQMKVTDSSTVYASTLAVPYSGSFVYYVNNNSAVRWNLVTGEKTSYSENAGFVIEPSSIHGSANGLVSYYSLNSQQPWDQRLSSVLFNTNNNTFLERTNTGYDPKMNLPPHSRVLSDYGGFCLRVNQRFIDKIETALSPVGYLPYFGAFVSFRPDNNDEIILAVGATISIISTHDLELLRTITLPAGYYFSSYDPVTHYVACAKMEGTVVYLVNIDTNQTKTVPAYSYGWTLMNGYLINNASQYIKVL